MGLEGQPVLADVLGGEIYMSEVFLVLKNQQIGVHVFLDNLAVLAFQQVRSRENDHIVLRRWQLGNGLKDAVWKRRGLPELLHHRTYYIESFIFILVK